MAPSPFSPPPPPHPTPKLHLSTGSLPAYISPSQPPTKQSPFRQIRSVPFIRSATLIVPDSLYDLLITALSSTPHLLNPCYAKLLCPLSSLLQGSFFTNHIKRPGSNILALSEGVAGVDDKFWIREGVLTMDLGKESYERAGLQGVVEKGSGARKHVKSRWRVEVEMRGTAALEGKKGWERVRRAVRMDGSLGDGRAWVVCEAEEGDGGFGKAEGLKELFPSVVEARMEDERREGVLVPDVLRRAAEPELDEEEWWEVVEWIDLVALGSPRVRDGDAVDSYISRYGVPSPSTSSSLRVLKWEGLMSSEWIMRLLIEVIKQSKVCKSKDWVAISVAGHQVEAVGRVDGYTVALQPARSEKTDQRSGGDQQPEDAVEMDAQTQDHCHQATGLQRFTCFQFID